LRPLRDFRVLDPRVYLLAFAQLVVMLGFSAVLPFLGISLAQDRGVPATTVGLIWTVSGLAGAAVQWVGGEIGDRLGRRPVVLASLVLRAGVLALLGFAILRESAIPFIALCCVANGVLRALFDPAAAAMVADLSDGDQRIAAFALLRVGLNIGWALGTMTQGLAAHLHWPFGRMFYGAAITTLLAAGACAFIPETRARDAPRSLESTERPSLAALFRRLGEYRQDRALLWFLAGTFALALLRTQMYAPLSLYAAQALGLGRAAVSHLYSLNGWMVVALQMPAYYAIRAIGTRRSLVLGAVAYAAGYGLCGAVSSERGLLLCIGVITLAEIGVSPAQQSTATSLATFGRVGAYAGLYGFASMLGQSLGPLLGAVLLDLIPARSVWALLPVFGLGAALFYRRAKPSLAELPARPGPLRKSPPETAEPGARTDSPDKDLPPG